MCDVAARTRLITVSAVLVALVPVGATAQAHTLTHGEAKRAMKRAVKRIEEPRVLGDRLADFAASYCYRGSGHKISCVAEGMFDRYGDLSDVYYCGGRYVAHLRRGSHRAVARPSGAGPPVRCREQPLLF